MVSRPFSRKQVNDVLIQLTCPYCYSIVGASNDEKLLQILEETHRCALRDLREGFKRGA
jgi:hypothetical protein